MALLLLPALLCGGGGRFILRGFARRRPPRVSRARESRAKPHSKGRERSRQRSGRLQIDKTHSSLCLSHFIYGACYLEYAIDIKKAVECTDVRREVSSVAR